MAGSIMRFRRGTFSSCAFQIVALADSVGAESKGDSGVPGAYRHDA